MVTPPPPAASAADPAAEDSRPSRTFGPPAAVVLGTLVAGVVVVVVLEFLVIISFVGQRLWRSPLLLTDLVFSLPFLIWVGLLLVSVVGMLRVLTAWLQVDGRGFTLRALGRRTVTGTWSDVGRVIAVRDIDRGATPAEMLEAAENAYDGVYLLDEEGRRLLAVSSRFFGPRAQEATLRHARAAGVAVEDIDAITTADLRHRFPQALTVVDRHPNLLLLGLAVFYVGHNVLTFAVWGL